MDATLGPLGLPLEAFGLHVAALRFILVPNGEGTSILSPLLVSFGRPGRPRGQAPSVVKSLSNFKELRAFHSVSSEIWKIHVTPADSQGGSLQRFSVSSVQSEVDSCGDLESIWELLRHSFSSQGHSF